MSTLHTALRLLMEGVEAGTARFVSDYEREAEGISRRISGEAAAMIVAERSQIACEIRNVLAEHQDEGGGTQFVITSLCIDGVVSAYSGPHPERTPVGLFPSREAAWEYARQMQLRHGSGGGSVEVAPLVAPSALIGGGR